MCVYKFCVDKLCVWVSERNVFGQVVFVIKLCVGKLCVCE